MMYNRYQQQLNYLYMEKCGNLYKNVTVLENTNNTGFLKLYIVNHVDKTIVNNATITIYVTDGLRRDIPIVHLITTLNPVRIELPMANVLGTLIVGPEYNFSTYDLRIDAFGYFSRDVYNIRLFPNETSYFEIELVPVTHIEAQPLIEERIDIPPHPRDVVIPDV